jgi:hypothetical protein
MKLFTLVALITRVFSQGGPGGLGNGGTTGVPQIAPTSNYTRYVVSNNWNRTVTPVVSLEFSVSPTGSSSVSASSSASASSSVSVSSSVSASSSVSSTATETPSPTSYQPLSLTPSITPSQTPTNAPRNTTLGDKNKNAPSSPTPDPTTITLGIIAACACVIGVIFVVNKTHKTMIRRRQNLFAPAVVISNPTQALGNQYGRAHSSV